MAKKQSEAEEVVSKTKTSAKKKRVFKAAPTLRDQTTQQQGKSAKKPKRIRRFFASIFRSKVFAPFRAIGRFVARIWRSKPLTPVRFIARWLGKILFPPYFRNSWKELKLVIWPDFRTTWRLTFAVILFGAVFGLAIAGLDVALEKLFREVLIGS